MKTFNNHSLRHPKIISIGSSLQACGYRVLNHYTCEGTACSVGRILPQTA